MMADEPPTKKSRAEHEKVTPDEEKEVIERSITLNLSTYPDWVGSLRDEELEKVFEIGVLVKESLQMTVSSNQKHLEEVLESQLEDKVASIGEKVSNKVQDIVECEEMILEEVRRLDQSVQALGKPKTKGSIAELTAQNILKAGLPKSYTVEDSSRFGNSGDVLVTTVEGEKFPIEVKDHTKQIAKPEIEKFEKVVEEFPEAKVGIMLSMKSGIARRSKRGKFEIGFSDKNKYFIYVPNAMEEENLIVWSVMLANELAQMNAELKDNQKSKLSALYDKFKKSMEGGKKSRSCLKSLEDAVKNLKESMEPILDIVEQSQNDIYKMLH